MRSYAIRGGSRRVAKFLSKSNTFHKKSKAIKMLTSNNFATLLGMPLAIIFKTFDLVFKLQFLQINYRDSISAFSKCMLIRYVTNAS